MDSPRRALVQLTRSAVRDALPIGRKLLQAARGAVESSWRDAVGEEIEDRLRRVQIHAPTSSVDPFGLDPESIKYALSAAWLVHRKYFRTLVFGAENVPQGRVLLISNHSGQIPLDGMMIATSLFFDKEPPRLVRSMVEKWTQTLPFVASLYPKWGQVVGVPENARKLLDMGEALLVFPEGSRGISKPFRDRYKMSNFGLGFLRLALETDTPVVPIAVVGAEEQYVNLGNVPALARALNMPSFPLIPQLLIPGYPFPLPTRYHIYFGKPLRFFGDPDDDDSVIEGKVQQVRGAIQAMIERGLQERRSIFG